MANVVAGGPGTDRPPPMPGREAEGSDRIRAEVLSGLSHEIRSALQSILASASLMQYTNLDDKQRSYTETIVRSGRGLQNLVENAEAVMRFGDDPIPKRIRFEVRDLLDSVVSPWAARAGRKSLGFFSEAGADVPRSIVSDPERVCEILDRLVDNAIRFTEHGYVSVRVTLDDRSGDRAVLRFVVSDSGVGIGADAQARLFAPQDDDGPAAFTPDTGLARCKALCESLDGEVGVWSEPGKGTRLWFTIGCDVATEKPEGPRDEAPGAIGRGDNAERGLRILIADDNDTNQVIIRDILEHHGHSVDTVLNGREAVRSVAERRYDLIFMDVQMPLMDGFQATRRIRKDLPAYADVPIIALTARAMKGDQELCIISGMTDYVSKPITIDQIVDVVAKHTGVAPTR